MLKIFGLLVWIGTFVGMVILSDSVYAAESIYNKLFIGTSIFLFLCIVGDSILENKNRKKVTN